MAHLDGRASGAISELYGDRRLRVVVLSVLSVLRAIGWAVGEWLGATSSLSALLAESSERREGSRTDQSRERRAQGGKRKSTAKTTTRG